MIIDSITPIGEKLIIEHPDCMLRFLFIIKETIRLIHTVSVNTIFSFKMLFDIFSDLLLTSNEVKGVGYITYIS